MVRVDAGPSVNDQPDARLLSATDKALFLLKNNSVSRNGERTCGETPQGGRQ
jgi:hypothetical protein